VPAVAAREKASPTSAAVSSASLSRSQTTSRWSLTKPTGNTTTARSPAAASDRRWSFTSGSSHGTDGGPLRLCHTRSNGRPGAAASTTACAAASSSAS
jgi:hypothetical protein